MNHDHTHDVQARTTGGGKASLLPFVPSIFLRNGDCDHRLSAVFRTIPEAVFMCGGHPGGKPRRISSQGITQEDHCMNSAKLKLHLMKYLSFSAVLIGSFLVCAFPAHVFAGLILDAELRVTYEDNVVGILSDQRGQVSSGSSGGGFGPMSMRAGGFGANGNGQGGYNGSGSGSGSGSAADSSLSPGDFSATLFAEAGGYIDVGRSSSLFAKGFAEYTAYDTYTDLDATIGGISAGISSRFTDILSGGLSFFGKVKRFGDSARDGNSFGGVLSLKQRFMPSFWLREFGEYEKNDANDPFFNYVGTRIGAGAGYTPSRKTLILLGYNYLVREYDEPAGSNLKAHTVSLSVEQALGKSWAVAGEYAFQASEDNVTNSIMRDNIFSLALRYSY
jgi:hypothetical protein